MLHRQRTLTTNTLAQVSISKTKHLHRAIYVDSVDQGLHFQSPSSGKKLECLMQQTLSQYLKTFFGQMRFLNERCLLLHASPSDGLKVKIIELPHLSHTTKDDLQNKCCQMNYTLPSNGLNCHLALKGNARFP